MEDNNMSSLPLSPVYQFSTSLFPEVETNNMYDELIATTTQTLNIGPQNPPFTTTNQPTTNNQQFTCTIPSTNHHAENLLYTNNINQ